MRNRSLEERRRWGAHACLEDALEDVLGTRGGPPQPAPPLLARAMVVLSSRLPAAETEVARRLMSHGLARSAVPLASLERAARHCDVQVPFVVFRRPHLVVALAPRDARSAHLVHALTVRAVARWGLARTGRMTYLSGLPEGFVRAVISARQDFGWLDRPRGWFWFSNPRAPIVRSIEKVLEVAGTIALDQLRLALFRGWAADNVPSRAALAALCAEVPSARLEGRAVTRAGGVTDALSDAEATLVRLLRDRAGEVSGDSLYEISAGLGATPAAVGRLLRSSPLVVERRPGVFRLIGAA